MPELASTGIRATQGQPDRRGEITVYTCSTNRRDPLREDQNTQGAEFVAFVDAPAGSSVWRQAKASDLFKSARRDARMHKILSHQFVQTEFSFWLDSNVALLVPAQRLVDEYLHDCDLAVFLHRTRDCTYQEADICARLELDSVERVARQVDKYRTRGLPAQAGLPETSVVLRRHSEAVQRFNNYWWSELSAFSVRDQIGFMYAARESGLRFRYITPTKFDHPYFSMTVRPAGKE